MLGSSKSTASLSSSLLARKGHARPAMRPQGFVALAPTPQHDDLGWNDMGEGHEPHAAPNDAADAPPVPAVLREREALAHEIARTEPEQPAPLGAGTVKRIARETTHAAKAAFTLRLDGERHLRLRLASAVTRRSAQQLVTEALDAFLDQHPDVEALACQIAPGTGRE